MAIRSKSVEGLDELIKAFNDLGDEALPYLMEGATEGGGVVLSKVKSKVPIDSGELKKNLKLTKAKAGKKNKYNVFSKVTFTPKVKYGIYVELGHKIVLNGNVVGTAKSQPFLRPGADESKDAVVDAIARALNKAIDKMGGLK